MQPQPSITELIEFRPATRTDEGFIYSTWLNGLYFGSDHYRSIDKHTFFKKYHDILDALLAKPSVAIITAALKESPDVLLAYAVMEQTDTDIILHWVFVKPVWRKMGIAKMLLPDTITKVTHLTKVGKSIKPQSWRYDPFLASP